MGDGTLSVYMSFVSLLRANNHVPQGDSAVKMSYQAIYNERQSCFCISGSKSWQIFQEDLEDWEERKVTLLRLLLTWILIHGSKIVDWGMDYS